jgi:hypothetical protein
LATRSLIRDAPPEALDRGLLLDILYTDGRGELLIAGFENQKPRC